MCKRFMATAINTTQASNDVELEAADQSGREPSAGDRHATGIGVEGAIEEPFTVVALRVETMIRERTFQ